MDSDTFDSNATWEPVLGQSTQYLTRETYGDLRTCTFCLDREGTIYENPGSKIAIAILEVKMRMETHPHCRCSLEEMITILAGTATRDGTDGADYVVKYTGKLPDNYISQDAAEKRGWEKKKGNLWDVLPGACVFTVHNNWKKKLPESPGRIWYEADLNYQGGYRNKHRLLFSNDGLIFVTYDHYLTYYQIV